MKPVTHISDDSSRRATAHGNNAPFGELLFAMSAATLRMRDFRILSDTNWTVRRGENWAVIGPNGAGKTTLMRALTGQVAVVAGHLVRHHPMAAPGCVGYVAFEAEQHLIDREMARDEARYFSGRADDLLRVKDIVLKSRPAVDVLSNDMDTAIKGLSLEHLWYRKVRQLSSGELRRVFIARALLKSKGLLILDEPFEGLDIDHRRHLKVTLTDLMGHGIQVILVSHRTVDIPHEISHIIALKAGRVYGQGLRGEMLATRLTNQLYESSVDTRQPLSKRTLTAPKTARPIIDIRGATVRYGDTVIFENLSWRINPGENWALAGPNGSGKTTLLHLIVGDHLQAYANEIYLFGRRRGTGESIWEIKQRFGVVSAELHRRYRKRIPAMDVVRSGFFDTIGLYRACTQTQQDLADKWVKKFKLEPLMARRFDQLSFGERKLILIIRAMVKTPQVRVLDEPCQGLDRTHRRRVLDLVDRIGQTTDTQILFVTHRPEEVPDCITHYFTMPAQNGSISNERISI